MHIIQRGNNRQATFYANEDYRFYLESLEKFENQYACAVHAYVLMTNHVHLLLTPSTDEGVSRFMQSIGKTLCTVCEFNVPTDRYLVGRSI